MLDLKYFYVDTQIDHIDDLQTYPKIYTYLRTTHCSTEKSFGHFNIEDALYDSISILFVHIFAYRSFFDDNTFHNSLEYILLDAC